MNETLTPQQYHNEVNSGKRVHVSIPQNSALARNEKRNKALHYVASKAELKAVEKQVNSELRIAGPFDFRGESLNNLTVLNTLADAGKIYKINRTKFCSFDFWKSLDSTRQTQEILQH